MRTATSSFTECGVSRYHDRVLASSQPVLTPWGPTMLRWLCLATVLLAAAPPSPAQVLRRALRLAPLLAPEQTDAPAYDAAKADKAALAAAKIAPTDADGLLAYFERRTLTDIDADAIQAVISRLGGESFADRLKAMDDAEKFGPAAVGPLRKAAAIDPTNVNAANFELAYRAGEVLKRLDKVPHAGVAVAAVRALAKVPHPRTSRVLLGFLPQADDGATAEEIQRTLVAVASVNGKADAFLVESLKDRSAAKRVYAATALIEGGDATLRVRVPDAHPKVVEAARVEADPDAKFVMTLALAVTARDKEAVAAILTMLPDLPRGRLWQAEDLLLVLAGADAPKVAFGATRPAVATAQAAWQAWWAKASPTLDLDKAAYTPRVQGKTLFVVMDPRNGSGYVTELGPDLKERWRMTNLSNPHDAQVLADGTVAVAENNISSVSVRDTAGRVLSQKSTTGNAARRIYAPPQQLQVVPGGDFVVVCRNVVLEMKRDKPDQSIVYERPNTHDIIAATRLPSGETAVLVQSQPDHLILLDKAGKELPDRKVATGPPPYQGHIVSSGPDRVLLTEAQKVVEYDLKEKKAVWSYAAPNARCLQRLPNGNTLIVDGTNSPDGSNRVVEVTPAGEEVWTHRLGGGLMIFRAYRR